MLRFLRVFTAFFLFLGLTFAFLDFSGILYEYPGLGLTHLARLQLVPAVIALELSVLVSVFVLTFLFGRIYCSVVCPLGIFQDIISRLSKWGGKKSKYQYSKGKTGLRIFFLLLAVVPVLAVGVSLGLVLLDPYSIYGRIATNILAPIYNLGNNILYWIFSGFGIHKFYYVGIYFHEIPATITAVLFLAVIGFLAWRFGRTWCNTVCPVGTVLGLIAKFSVFKIRIDKDKCVRCGLCTSQCKAACLNGKEQKMDASRCVDCFNCLGSCPKKAISWRIPFFGKKNSASVESGTSNDNSNAGQNRTDQQRKSSSETVDANKRDFIVSLALVSASAVTAKLALADDKKESKDLNESSGKNKSSSKSREDSKTVTTEKANDADKNVASSPAKEVRPQDIPPTAPAGMKKFVRENPITPPGSIDRERFAELCTACHLCVSKCPAHILRPAILEYGLTGFLQPRVEFSRGFCNFDCTICTDVCPNKALEKLTIEQKHRNQMGIVHFILENCIVYADGTSCGACSEHCPTQAVKMVPYKGELTLPEIDTDICVGCGGCEYICPARPNRAIYIEGNSKHLEAKKFEVEKKKEVNLDGFGF